MYIIGGTAGKTIAKDLSELLDCPLARTDIKRFPDGEAYVRILDDVKDEDVVIVQTTHPDMNLVELLIMEDAAYEAGAKSITVVLPYFGYSRQDHRFNEGEAISSRMVGRVISVYANRVLAIDPHKEHILDFFDAETSCCTAVCEIAAYLKEKDIDFVLAPDKGALKRAEHAAGMLDCKYDYMEKTRIDGSTVTVKPKNLDASGRRVAILDDIISTGGTMAESIRQLKGQGAKAVFVCCTHGLLIEGAVEKLRAAGCDEIIATDTIPGEYSVVSCAPCLIESLRQ